MTREQEIQHHTKQLKISREEAEQLYEDDHSDTVLPEVAEMEAKAKKLKRRYEGDTTKRAGGGRTQKIDSDKVEIIQTIAKNLTRCVFDQRPLKEPHNITIKNPQQEVTFYVGEDFYSVTLTKHRKARET